MEHSYSKDFLPKDNVEVMATRTILIPKPPQCPSCHNHTSNEDLLAKLENQQNDAYFDQLPTINDNIAKMAMDETDRLTRNAKNVNSDDEDWDVKVNKFGWTKQQLHLYRQITNILDYDQLARLAVNGRQNEGIIRRCSIDKSVARMRLALASVHWDLRLTQWLHALLSDHLPPSYMASYLDILQTLRTKCPTLVDKMLTSRPIAFNQDYLQAVLKRPWGANVPTKQRKLPGQLPVILVVSSSLQVSNQHPSSRMKRWLSLLGTMATVIPIQYAVRQSQTLEQITEQLVAVTRSKIQELRSEMPNRHIMLVGINAGASIVLQVAFVETVSSIVCMGFAYNTFRGVRGAPDDRILDVTTPILFILGENSARSSQEEIESLREKMSAQTSLVVVGSADDALRINKFSRHLEGVTQSVVDNMIADEIQDFVSTCIINPPGPREVPNNLNKRSISMSSAKSSVVKKRKHKDSVYKVDKGTPRKVGRPRLNKPNEMPSGKFKPERPKPTSALLKQSNESLKMAIQSILPQNDETIPNDIVSSTDQVAVAIPNEPTIINTSDLDGGEILSTYEVVSAEPDNSANAALQPITTVTPPIASNTIKLVPSAGGQFVQVTPPTTTGRIQSPNVKNFFIRKGVEKKTPTQPFFTLRTQPITTETTATTPTSKISPNKKIIIKSQQIIKPASNVNQAIVSNQSGVTIDGTLLSSVDSTPTIAQAELSDILDLPILFADSDGAISDLHSEVVTTQIASPSIQIASNESTSTTPNVLITTPEGKLPNRPVVISAANITKTVKATTHQVTPSSKAIFINRLPSDAQYNMRVKSMPPLKLVSTSTSATPITGVSSTQFTKLAPGTKIDLSTLKILKSGTGVPGTSLVHKPIVFNKAGMQTITTQPTRNTIVIKPASAATRLQTHPAIKTGILNRNITVRKVVNLVPSGKQTTNAQIVVTSTGAISDTTSPSPAAQQAAVVSTAPVTSS